MSVSVCVCACRTEQIRIRAIQGTKVPRYHNTNNVIIAIIMHVCFLSLALVRFTVAPRSPFRSSDDGHRCVIFSRFSRQKKTQKRKEKPRAGGRTGAESLHRGMTRALPFQLHAPSTQGPSIRRVLRNPQCACRSFSLLCSRFTSFHRGGGRSRDGTGVCVCVLGGGSRKNRHLRSNHEK